MGGVFWIVQYKGYGMGSATSTMTSLGTYSLLTGRTPPNLQVFSAFPENSRKEDCAYKEQSHSCVY
jgi:hypothetical protein